MKNAFQPGKVIDIWSSDRDYSSGDITRIGAAIGIIATDVLTGGETELALTGVFSVPCVNTLAATIGTVVGLDVANKQIVAAGAGDADIGMIVYADVTAGDTTCYVRLDGVAKP